MRSGSRLVMLTAVLFLGIKKGGGQRLKLTPSLDLNNTHRKENKRPEGSHRRAQKKPGARLDGFRTYQIFSVTLCDFVKSLSKFL